MMGKTILEKEEFVGWLDDEWNTVLDQSQPIVRCRDCRHYDPNDEPSEVYPDRYWCELMAMYLQPNGFCAWGERKEDGDDAQ